MTSFYGRHPKPKFPASFLHTASPKRNISPNSTPKMSSYSSSKQPKSRKSYSPAINLCTCPLAFSDRMEWIVKPKAIFLSSDSIKSVPQRAFFLESGLKNWITLRTKNPPISTIKKSITVNQNLDTIPHALIVLHTTVFPLSKTLSHFVRKPSFDHIEDTSKLCHQ